MGGRFGQRQQADPFHDRRPQLERKEMAMKAVKPLSIMARPSGEHRAQQRDAGVSGFVSRRSREAKFALLGPLVISAALMTTAAGPAASSASVGGARASRQVVFYADVANTVPGTAFSKNVPRVRPAIVLLTEDGSAVLEKLHWSSWGGSVARATGNTSTSNCVPDCAEGKRTIHSVRFVLSQRRHMFGHTVYACYQLIDPKASQTVHDCLKHSYANQYYYAPVAASHSAG
jgi:hypothetical protein